MFLIRYGRTKGFVMGTLSRESELKRVRIKVSHKNGAEDEHRADRAFKSWLVNGDVKNNFLRIAIETL